MTKKITKIVLTLSLMFAPFIIVNVLFALHGFNVVDISLDFFNGIIFSDEYLHLKQAISFSDVGFETGYYTANEIPASFELSHFYAWGPLPPMLYGTFMRMTGIIYPAFISVHSIIFAICSIFFVVMARPNIKQLLLICTVVGTYPVLIIYFPLFMLEGLHLSLALIVGAISFRILDSENENHWRQIVFYSGLILLISLLRFTWSLLLIPLLMISVQRVYPRWGILIGGFLALALAIIPFMFSQLVSAPFGSSVSVLEVISSVFESFTRNLYLFFATRNSFWGFRIVFLLVTVWQVVALILKIMISRRKHKTLNIKKESSELFFHFMNLVLLLFLAAAANSLIDGRDARILGPHLLVSLIVLVLLKHYRIVYVVLLIFMITLPSVVSLHKEVSSIHFVSESRQEEINALSSELQVAIPYDSELENAWCNTVLIHYHYLFRSDIWLAFDRGLGLSWFRSPEQMIGQVKSRYVLLPDNMEIPQTWRLETYLPILDGTIYRNLDADCP